MIFRWLLQTDYEIRPSDFWIMIILGWCRCYKRWQTTVNQCCSLEKLLEYFVHHLSVKMSIDIMSWLLVHASSHLYQTTRRSCHESLTRGSKSFLVNLQWGNLEQYHSQAFLAQEDYVQFREVNTSALRWAWDDEAILIKLTTIPKNENPSSSNPQSLPQRRVPFA